MKKRVNCIVLCLLLLVPLFLNSCGSSDSQVGTAPINDFEEIKRSFWVAREKHGDIQHYKMCTFTDTVVLVFDFSRGADKNWTDIFTEMLANVPPDEILPLSAFDLTYLFYVHYDTIEDMQRDTYVIAVDTAEGKIVVGDNELVFNYYNNDTLKCNEDTYYRHSTLDMDTAFNAAKNSVEATKREKFFAKYKGALTNRQVQYDPVNSLGKSFVISGKAILDDYYNYEYATLNSKYFCIEIEPTGGGYTNRWRVYADREEFRLLFERLQCYYPEGGAALTLEGGATLTLVCKAQFSNASQHRMATLVDYYFIG